MIKVRPHALHRIMGEPKSIDPELITDEVAAILRRTKRTDEEKALIQSLKNRTLSEVQKLLLKNGLLSALMVLRTLLATSTQKKA